MLNAYECQVTHFILNRWILASMFAMLSFILAYTLKIQQVHYSAFVYFALPLVLLLYSVVNRRTLKA